MTDNLVSKGNALSQAVAYTLEGNGEGAIDLLERHFPTARDSFVAAYGLAHAIVATTPGEGDGVVVELERLPTPPGVTVGPHDDDAASLTAALLGAAGNGDVDGACRAFFSAGDVVAGGAIGNLLRMCAAVVRDTPPGSFDPPPPGSTEAEW